MSGRATEVEVANKLEELIPAIKEMIVRLRTGEESQPYAAVYWLRRELSHEVAKLGAGAPNTKNVERHYSELMQEFPVGTRVMWTSGAQETLTGVVVECMRGTRPAVLCDQRGRVLYPRRLTKI